MKTTTTETKKTKTKAPTEEQIAASKTYEDELESAVNKLVKEFLLAAVMGREAQFGTISVDHDKRSAPKKIRDLIARGLIEELPKNQWGDIPYRVTEKAVATSAPPLTDAELDALLLHQYEKQVADMRRANRPFRDFWKSAPAVKVAELPRQALRTIVMRPDTVIAARCDFDEHQPPIFVPYTIGSAFVEVPRSDKFYRRHWLDGVDSILVARPVIAARWRQVLEDALRRHLEVSAETLPVVLGIMLGTTTKKAGDALTGANCYRGFGHGDGGIFEKKNPNEWPDVLREHIAHAKKKASMYRAAANDAATLLSQLESIPDIDKSFAHAVDEAVEANVKSIP